METAAPFLRAEGYCPICEAPRTFASPYDWLRDHFKCEVCKSLPRERALALVLGEAFPDWRRLSIHESSPGTALSDKIWKQCPGYTPSAYDLRAKFGAVNPATGCRTEDLEYQTFEDGRFDIVITQDIFEHLFDPEAAAREIARTLKPGGAHIFTVPIVRKWQPARRRAQRTPGGVTHLLPAEYHVDPFNREAGALVTMDWGYDIAATLDRASGMNTVIMHIDDLHHGVRAEYIEVLLSRKPLQD